MRAGAFASPHPDVPSSGVVVSPGQVVMSGCRGNLYYFTGPLQMNSQSPHFALDSGTRLKIVLPNWYYSSSGEADGTSTITYTAALWSYSGGSIGSLLGAFQFGGSTSGVCPIGGLLESDWLTVNFFAGNWYIIRTWASSSGGILVNQYNTGNGDLAHGNMMEFSSTITDKTQSGASLSGVASYANAFAPIAIISDTVKPNYLMLGDSLTYSGAAGKGDTFDGTSPFIGFPDRSLGAAGLAGINLGSPGENAQTFAGSNARRAALKLYTSGVWNNYGINDVANGRTAAQLQTDLQTINALFSGMTVLEGKIGYEATSTDSFATAGNQTVSSSFGPGQAVDTINAATISGVSQMTSHLDAIFDSSTHKWFVDGAASTFTVDGTHITQLGAKTIGERGLNGLYTPKYATWDPTHQIVGNTVLTNNNLTMGSITSSTPGASLSTIQPTGLVYVEAQISTTFADTLAIGLYEGTATLDGGSGQDQCMYWVADGIYNNAGSLVGLTGSVPNGSWICIAMNFNTKKAWWRIGGGSWNGNSSHDPVTGVGGVDFSDVVNATFYASVWDRHDTWTLNFGASAFTQTPPLGYKGLSKTPVYSATALDPANKHANITLSGSNLVATATATATDGQCTRSLQFHSGGKYLIRVVPTVTVTNGAGQSTGFGFATSAITLSKYLGEDTTGMGVFPSGNMYYNNTPSGTHQAFNVGDTYDIALDLVNNIWWTRANGGAWTGSGDPLALTGGLNVPVGLRGVPLYFIVDVENSGAVVTCDFTPSGILSGYWYW